MNGMLPYAMTMLLMTLVACGLHAQDSPCNQGRAVWPRVDPRHDRAICVPEIGRRNGVLSCTSGTEAYGSSVSPIGRITSQGSLGWVMSRVRCDTLPEVEEVLLYRGIHGSLPPVVDGERIGPREILARTRFLTAGDWDNSGTVDLSCYIKLYGDTSAGENPQGYEYGYTVIFWSDSSGNYSIDDTTRLQCDAQRWLGVNAAIRTDRNNDGIDDLFVVDFGGGYSEGMVRRQARGHLYLGHEGKRWGRAGVGRSADWRWWNTPSLYSFLKEIDQDGDGNLDIVWFGQSNAPYAQVTVWYGSGGHGISDTTTIERVDLINTNGHGANYIDISNDGVPELIVNCGSEEQLAVFVGIRGQRLIEQYGSGHERFDTARGDRWWTKPFARVWLPYRINDAWPQSTWDVVYDLGDANDDGYRDIWVGCRPFLLCYTSGPALDSLVDAIVDERPAAALGSAQGLGRILGEDQPPVFGIGLSNGIIYARPDNLIPARSTGARRWPEGTLGPRMGADRADNREDHTGALRVTAAPNPSTGEVEIRWDAPSGAADLRLTDLTGREVLSLSVEPGVGHYRLRRNGLPSGLYLASIRAADRVGTAVVVLY